MPDNKKAIGLVDLRISVTFHRSPEVHTLLSMTNKRDRARLIVEALLLYIEQTNHPAAEVETQLHSVASFLNQRKGLQPKVRDRSDEVNHVIPEVRVGAEVIKEQPLPAKETVPVPDTVGSASPEPSAVSDMAVRNGGTETEENAQHDTNASEPLMVSPPSGIHNRWMED